MYGLYRRISTDFSIVVERRMKNHRIKIILAKLRIVSLPKREKKKKGKRNLKKRRNRKKLQIETRINVPRQARIFFSFFTISFLWFFAFIGRVRLKRLCTCDFLVSPPTINRPFFPKFFQKLTEDNLIIRLTNKRICIMYGKNTRIIFASSDNVQW